MGASNAGRVGKKRDSGRISGCIGHLCIGAYCSQTYLQRPSPWGRATAERLDVESHSYRNAEEIFSTFIQPADVGSHHLEY